MVGALPESLQLKTIYSGGLAAKSASPAEAKALLAFLTSAEAAPIWQRFGFSLAR